MLVHRDCPPSENGATPLALIFGTISRMSPPGLRRLDADLVEHLLVVVQDDRLHRFGRHRVDLAVDRGGAERRREQLVLDVGVRGEPAGEVVDLVGLHVAAQPAAAPAPDDGRCLAGADRRFDLGLVRVVLELGIGDLAGLAGLVERFDRVLPDRLLGRSGQEPVGRTALAAATPAGGAGSGVAGGPSRAGLARPGTAACRSPGQDRHAERSQAEEVTARHSMRFHADLRTRASRRTADVGLWTRCPATIEDRARPSGYTSMIALSQIAANRWSGA